jgi:hypothetical protein
MYHIKIDIPTLDKLLNINSGMKLQYENIDTGEMLSSCEPWNKGKKGWQQSTRKGVARSEETKKKISSTLSKVMKGKKHTKETKEKIRQLKLGKKRLDLIGNSFASNRDNSKYRTEAFRQKMREVAKRRWANA